MDPFESSDDHRHGHEPGEVSRQTWVALAGIVVVVVLVLVALSLTSAGAMPVVGGG